MTTKTRPVADELLDAKREIERTLAESDADYEPLDTRPTWRGWLHAFAFVAAVFQAGVLIPLAAIESGRAALGASLYCATMLAMFGTSALYHRRRWSTRGWKVMKRLDHCMIFLFIAGTYTPFCALGLPSPTSWWVLGIVWAGAAAGATLKIAWPGAPRWLGVTLYIVLGWVIVAVAPALVGETGLPVLILLALGGVFYSVGGVLYAARWPDPWPETFGHHEVFHACTAVAALLHYVAAWLLVFG